MFLYHVGCILVMHWICCYEALDAFLYAFLLTLDVFLYALDTLCYVFVVFLYALDVFLSEGKKNPTKTCTK